MDDDRTREHPAPTRVQPGLSQLDLIHRHAANAALAESRTARLSARDSARVPTEAEMVAEAARRRRRHQARLDLFAELRAAAWMVAVWVFCVLLCLCGVVIWGLFAGWLHLPR